MTNLGAVSAYRPADGLLALIDEGKSNKRFAGACARGADGKNHVTAILKALTAINRTLLSRGGSAGSTGARLYCGSRDAPAGPPRQEAIDWRGASSRRACAVR